MPPTRFVVALALAGCATAPRPAPISPVPPPAAVTPPPVASPPGAGAVEVPPPPPSVPAELLLDLVPADAVAVVVVRRAALAPLRAFLDGDPEMRADLSRYLEQALGVDLTRLEAAVYATRLGPAPRGGLILRLPGVTGLGRPQEGEHDGVPLIRVGGDLRAAVVGELLVVADADAIASAIDRARGRAAPLAPGAPLEALLALDHRDADLEVAVAPLALSSPVVAPVVDRFGVRGATLVYRGSGRVTLRVSGDPARLPAARDLLRQLSYVALRTAQQEMEKATAGERVAEAVGTIVAFHQLRRFLDEVEPRMEGDALVSEYQLPRLQGTSAILPYVGMAAAIAVPAFQKYLVRSKAAEARASLERLQLVLSEYVDARRPGPGDGKRFAFPPSTKWSPEVACCAQPERRCQPSPEAFGERAWRALGFALDAPHYYQYRFISEGRGRDARFTVEARGDLDCDGIHSVYRLSGRVSPEGALELTFPPPENELE